MPIATDATIAAIEEHALRANDRYLLDVIERYAFCPFSREGRQQGMTVRFVHYPTTVSVAPLLELMRRAAESGVVVAQLILPGVEIDPDAFVRFCADLTDLGHRCMDEPVFAVAPLHPELRYGDTPHAMVNLFRRAPDPTIQWVRLDGLREIYAGRESDASYVAPEDIPSYIAEHPRGRPRLYDRICTTNAQMAKRLGIDTVVELLAEIADEARRQYIRLLLEDA